MKNIYIGICVGIIAITSIAHAEPSDPTLYFKNNSKHTIRLTLLDTARQRIQLGYYAAQFIIDPDESLTNNQFSIEQIGGMLIEYCKEEKKDCFCPSSDLNCIKIQQEAKSQGRDLYDSHEIKFHNGVDTKKIYLTFELVAGSPRVKPQQEYQGKNKKYRGKTTDKRFSIENNIKEKDISVVRVRFKS